MLLTSKGGGKHLFFRKKNNSSFLLKFELDRFGSRRGVDDSQVVSVIA